MAHREFALAAATGNGGRLAGGILFPLIAIISIIWWCIRRPSFFALGYLRTTLLFLALTILHLALQLLALNSLGIAGVVIGLAPPLLASSAARRNHVDQEAPALMVAAGLALRSLQ